MKKVMQLIKKSLFFMTFVCSTITVHAHVIVQSFVQNLVEVVIVPGKNQSMTCAKKFELSPFSRLQLSGGDGTYACKSVLIRVNNQAPQMVDFSAIDQVKNDVVLQIIPKESFFNVQAIASIK